MTKSAANHSPRITYPLMGMAALLILNSHLEPLYARRYFAADGLVGNLIFYFLAGFGVMKSQLLRPDQLGPFYARRIWRIYPSLWIVLTIGVLTGTYLLNRTEPLAWIHAYGLALGYGFITMIMVLYPLVWWLARLSRNHMRHLVRGLGVLWIAIWLGCLLGGQTKNLSLGELPSSLWWAFFGFATCLGAWAARFLCAPLPLKSFLLQGLILGAVYLALKFEMALRYLTTPNQMPSAALGGLVQASALALIWLLVRQIETINDWLRKLRLETIFGWVGKYSLQLYLIHPLVLAALLQRSSSQGWKPILTVFTMSLLLAWLLGQLVSYIKIPRRFDAR
jgi:peptidoglycan/LPS O-acetylase OafA/YrhL